MFGNFGGGTPNAGTTGTTTTTHVGGPIMPRDELLARMNEEEAALRQVRLVSPTSASDEHTAPLLPPPPMSLCPPLTQLPRHHLLSATPSSPATRSKPR